MKERKKIRKKERKKENKKDRKQERQKKNKAKYTAPDAYFSPSKITRDMGVYSYTKVSLILMSP